MWKNILKGTAVVTVLLGVLASLGTAMVSHDLRKSFEKPLDDNDVM